MIHTFLQILVYQFLFLAVYDLSLKKETFFNLNRAYLMITPIVSILLPFISLGFIQQNIPQQYYVQLPAVILGGTASEIGTTTSFWLSSLKSIWIAGMIVSALIFSYKILKVVRLKRSGTTANIEGSKVTILPKTDTAFSFFNTIYLGEDISEENKPSIIAHEKMHIRQRHSFDLLYFELLRIVFWFCPAVYMFQNRISTLHEYIADAEILRQKSKKEYYQNLLSEVFQTQQISFINTFFKHSLTRLTLFGRTFVFGTSGGQVKNRIIMLQKSKSPKARIMKYLILLPLLGSILIYTSCTTDTENLHKQEQISGEIPLPPAPPLPPPPPLNKGYQDVPYSVIEKVPSYPECTGDNEAMKKCVSTKISEFVNKNFNTDVIDNSNIAGRQRIAVQFTIDPTGKVVDVRARGNHPELEAEAIRVVKMLPQMTPGEQKGEKVGVLYSLPIVFDVK